jgi:hypothetical protein
MQTGAPANNGGQLPRDLMIDACHYRQPQQRITPGELSQSSG